MDKRIRRIVKKTLRNSKIDCVSMGESASYNWVDDPARLLFTLSRYKFVSKMFKGFGSVLEVGCADGFASYLVSKSVSELTAVDTDIELIASAVNTVGKYSTNIDFICGDVRDPLFLRGKTYQGAFLLDVLEHIEREQELEFLVSIIERLEANGSLIIGIPSLESQRYASSLSKLGHVNCKTQDELRLLCDKLFRNVFLFGANDEVIHTGHPGMQHYRFALCNTPAI